MKVLALETKEVVVMLNEGECCRGVVTVIN